MAKRVNKKKENKKQPNKFENMDDALKAIEGYSPQELYKKLTSHLQKREIINQENYNNETIIAKIDEQLRKKL